MDSDVILTFLSMLLAVLWRGAKQITPYVIHEFGEFAVKFKFITTLLVTKFGRDQKALVPSSSKVGGPVPRVP